MEKQSKLSKAQAGKLGGIATFKKYGSAYMSMIGKRGAAEFHRKYKIVPFGACKYAIVARETATAINFF
jgi:hypothetical protein